MSPSPRVGRLHVITDVIVQSRFSHEELAAMACAGGADSIQLRDKQLSDDAFLAVARRVLEVCRRHGVALVVNDRIDIARELGTDGVHVGRGDATVVDARGALGDTTIIGASAGSIDEALAAEGAGADYVGFGHIFPTMSKVKDTAPLGLEVLAEACARVHIPVIAIGGITADNAGGVIRAGAWGIAVIQAVCAADDPRAATMRLREAIGRS